MTRLTITLLAALVLATATGTTAQAQVNEQDSLALVALFNASDGNNWTNNAKWLTGPVATWYGVTVADGLVTELILAGNQLTEAIPAELGNLTNLNFLYLYDNQLSAIPSELGNLANLENLSLAANQLSGAIPPELANLENLSLAANQLSEAIPPELGNLLNLIDLRLHDNLLTGTLPLNLTNLLK